MPSAEPVQDTPVALSEARPDAPSAPRSRATARRSRGRGRGRGWVAFLFVAPALLVYAVFVLRPLVYTVWYSLYHWDGIGASTWVGLDNYREVFSDPELLGTIGHAFELIP